MERKTNWIAIVVAAVACMLLGFLWYGVLFNAQWMAGNGITMEGEKFLKNGTEMPMSSMPMVINTFVLLTYAVIMNWILGRMNARTLADGATVGAAIGGMMALGVMIGNMFAANPFSLSICDGSYSLVSFIVLGAIIGGWQKK